MKPLIWVALLAVVHGGAQARSKLRPEHLEPERVEVERPTVKLSEKRTPAPSGRAIAAREQCQRASELFVAGNFTEAAAVYKQVLAAANDYGPAHRGLGFVYQRLNFNAMAIAELEKYLALTPNAADTDSITARIARLGGPR